MAWQYSWLTLQQQFDNFSTAIRCRRRQWCASPSFAVKSCRCVALNRSPSFEKRVAEVSKAQLARYDQRKDLVNLVAGAKKTHNLGLAARKLRAEP